MSNKHSLALPQMSAAALTEVLEAPGWSKTPADIMLAGQLLVDVLPEITRPEAVVKARTQAECRKADAAWCDLAIAFEVSEKQREAVKRCLTHWTEKGALPGGRYSAALLAAFGFTAE
jgi:hypothetical protein